MENYEAAAGFTVVLTNGYRFVPTRHGDAIQYEGLETLDQALVEAVLCKPGRLTGGEIIYLRLQLDLTQTRLADILDVSAESISNWERARFEIGSKEDALLRKHFLEANIKTFRQLNKKLGVGELIRRSRGRHKLVCVGSWNAGWGFIYTPAVANLEIADGSLLRATQEQDQKMHY